ncbi:MAG: hypothetical protein KDD69_16560 [Bdellovibrionales bacterium]|nr:hypothetical protein [Bdellovibrionales bacterium]
MAKVSELVRGLLLENGLLLGAMGEGLLNLTQTAHFLRPQVEARAKRPVQPGAIAMSLSRLAREQIASPPKEQVQIENMVVHTDLAVVTYLKNADVHQAVNLAYNKIQRAQGYITITEGIREITIIFSRRRIEEVERSIPQKPLHRDVNVAALGLTFPASHIGRPGLFYIFFQQLYFQNINVVEQASTATELILYLHQDDVQLAFETFYNRFVRTQDY